VQHNTDPKFLIVLGALILFTMQMVASSATSYTTFFWFYALSWPINQGLCYLVPIHQSWLWFPRSPGFVSGIVIAGFSLGTLVFDMLSTKLVNPDNLPVDDPAFEIVIKERFVYMLRTLLICYMAIALLGAIFIFQGPKEEHRDREETETNFAD